MLAAREAADYPHDGAPVHWGLSELVEAAARSGRTELAADAFARLEPITGTAGTDWALGIQARAQALSDGGGAERLYREAIEWLGRTRLRGELARARLLYRRNARRAHAPGGTDRAPCRRAAVISPRTVEYHLSKVFLKLEISNRKELRRALPDASRAPSLV